MKNVGVIFLFRVQILLESSHCCRYILNIDAINSFRVYRLFLYSIFVKISCALPKSVHYNINIVICSIINVPDKFIRLSRLMIAGCDLNSTGIICLALVIHLWRSVDYTIFYFTLKANEKLYVLMNDKTVKGRRWWQWKIA